MRAAIGAESEPTIMEVERGAIRRFADAIDDPNPLYRDEEYAKNTRLGGIIAPPTFFGWPYKQGKPASRVKNPFTRVLNGGTEVEYFQPIHAGDTLIATTKLVDIQERQGRPGIGRMLFQVRETTYKNQKGEVVAISRGTTISYEGPRS
ncbi:MAG: MaoC family dehydratase N-terminal domain-containing protein [Chloroflexi bacterium]|nr:MaoC family dehydratase N-terminal domain-containing protein [Chloroflexota bacterium]